MTNNILYAVLVMAGLSAGFAVLISLAYKYFKVEENPAVKVVEDKLPGLNCGACGFASCHVYAEHIVNEKDMSAVCVVADAKTIKEIALVAGLQSPDIKNKVKAVVCCNADRSKVKISAEYSGEQTCKAAAITRGGFLECKYGCLGLGDCVDVCPFDAIKIVDGLAVIDANKCTGCGKCTEVCPRGIISLIEVKNNYLVRIACSSKDSAVNTRKTCKAGCISCKICEKKADEGVFVVKENLSVIDYKKVKQPEKLCEAVKNCPVKCIVLDKVK